MSGAPAGGAGSAVAGVVEGWGRAVVVVALDPAVGVAARPWRR